MGDVVSFPHEEEPEEKKEPEEQVPPQSVFGRTMGVIYSPKILRPLSNLLKMIHVVQDGDTLSSIARKYGTTVEKLKKLNHLTDEQAGQLKTGQKIRYK
jgi:nucleoid-associated protein YgaU